MMFKSMYSNFTPKTGLDYSNVYRDLYKEVPAKAYDINTGKMINPSSCAKFVKIGKEDFNEKIQSFAAETDIYTLLERFAVSGDTAYINKSIGSYMDISNLPDNFNDFQNLLDKYWASIAKTDKELGQAILNEKLSLNDINKIIENKVAEALKLKDGDSNVNN